MNGGILLKIIDFEEIKKLAKKTQATDCGVGPVK